MKKLKFRFQMAWKAFWFIPFEIQLEPFHHYCKLRSDREFQCDNKIRTGCERMGKVALAETVAKLEVSEQNYYHLCLECAKEAVGKEDKLEFKF